MISEASERRRLERLAAHLAAVVESSADAIISKTVDGAIVSWNPGAERLYGYSEAEVKGKSIALLVPEDHDDDVPKLLALVVCGERVDQYETVRRRKDGSIVEVSLTISAMRDSDGRVVGASTIARDITERKRTDELLRRLADHDSLTGLHNRRVFEENLTLQVGRCQRYDEKAALLLIDLDGFKQINDTHGHGAGDNALKVVAEAITRRLRSTDFVARIGGDEFAVLLPHASNGNATLVAQGIRRAIAQTTFQAGASVPHLAASIGIAAVDKSTPEAAAVLMRADRAMYAAKRSRTPSPPPRS